MTKKEYINPNAEIIITEKEDVIMCSACIHEGCPTDTAFTYDMPNQ